MGLGAPKRRNKLSHDPNNTTWSKSTENFGHRILASQGWQPGDYLGAENASHADHYSAANASHIRVMLREDNLGIGAKVGGNKAETFGLSLFSGVLGRLNGKGEAEVEKQQGQLRDAELRSYAGQKYGIVGFVSGGLLVGDKIEKTGDLSALVKKEELVEDEIADRKDRKRKVAELDAGDEARTEKKTKRSKTPKTEDLKVEDVKIKIEEDDSATPVQARPKKKSKRSTSMETEELLDSDNATAATERKISKKRRRRQELTTDSTDELPADEKARLKQEKRARKEERRRRKEEKRLRKSSRHASPPIKQEDSPEPVVQSVQPPGGGRHAVRHRYIQQKRMASMNAQAMKEIFMVKAGA